MSTEYQTVVITGAGSGLGAALAARYARAGWQVAITDQDPDRARETLESLKAEGGSGFSLELDVRNEDHWTRLIDRVRLEWPGVGLLINNAGVATAGTVIDTPLEDWQWVLDIDLMGVVRGCRHFAAIMQDQGTGHIVNMSSFAGLAGAPFISSYGVAKAGVVALSEALRAELHASGVKVSVVCPAFIETRLTETMRSTKPGTQEQVQRWMRRSPIDADGLAEQVFLQAAKGRFLILTHPETRWAWRLKRWWPERYFSVLARKLALKKN